MIQGSQKDFRRKEHGWFCDRRGRAAYLIIKSLPFPQVPCLQKDLWVKSVLSKRQQLREVCDIWERVAVSLDKTVMGNESWEIVGETWAAGGPWWVGDVSLRAWERELPGRNNWLRSSSISTPGKWRRLVCVGIESFYMVVVDGYGDT